MIVSGDDCPGAQFQNILCRSIDIKKSKKNYLKLIKQFYRELILKKPVLMLLVNQKKNFTYISNHMASDADESHVVQFKNYYTG